MKRWSHVLPGELPLVNAHLSVEMIMRSRWTTFRTTVLFVSFSSKHQALVIIGTFRQTMGRRPGVEHFEKFYLDKPPALSRVFD